MNISVRRGRQQETYWRDIIWIIRTFGQLTLTECGWWTIIWTCFRFEMNKLALDITQRIILRLATYRVQTFCISVEHNSMTLVKSHGFVFFVDIFAGMGYTEGFMSESNKTINSIRFLHNQAVNGKSNASFGGIFIILGKIMYT